MRYALVVVCLLACSRGATSKPRDRGSSKVGTASDVAPASPSCGVSARTVLTGSGVGELQVGKSVERVRGVCAVVRDTTLLGDEALPERQIAVAVAGDTILATIDSGRVWRITLERPKIRTVDSLGVGSRLSDLLRQPRATGEEGEGVLYVLLPSHCGLSFRIAHELADNEHRATWSARDLENIPQESMVDEVLVTGCEPAS